MSIENSCRFIGNLGSDPETRYSQDGTCFCNFSLGVNKHYKDRSGEKKEVTEWPRIVASGKIAETLSQYAKKGMMIIVICEFRLRKWTGSDNVDHYSPEFHVERFKFLGGGRGERQERSDDFPTHGGSQNSNRAQNRNTDPFADNADFGDVPVDDDIPF